MDRIDTATKVVDLFGAGKHGFRDGDLALGVAPTYLNAKWFNAAQEELVNIIEAAGIVPDGAVRTQVRQAVKRLFGGNVTTINAANSPYALTADNAGLVIMDATAGNIVANLPAVNVIAQPLRFNFVRADATANTATVNRAGADTFVGGATSFALIGQGDTATATGDAVSKWALQSVTERFKGANQSLAASGYQKLPGGLILQWGTLASPGANTNTPVTFPVAFPTACRFVTTSGLAGSIATAGSDGGTATSLYTTTNFNIVNSWDGSISPVVLYWFAVGH